ncbi:MAG: PD-(D/E)XK motif protein [Bacteroidota bacterium]
MEEFSTYKIFTQLKQRSSIKDCLSVAPLPFSKKHKIGISGEGFPMFFIECDGLGYSLDTNLEYISVQFNRQCQLFQEDEQKNEQTIHNTYTIISLKTDEIDFLQYFIEVVSLVLSSLPECPTHAQLKVELKKLIDLFSRFNKPPRRTIQGLWAELLVIEQAKFPEYLIQSWHVSAEDKFDFNDSRDKIEVKSTSKSRRIHSFSAEQLNPNRNSNLLIASVFVIQTGIGKNIFDLVQSICIKVTNPALQFRLNEIIGQTLGQDFDKSAGVRFDYQQAVDTLNYFDFNHIPTIQTSNIPETISNVHFDCDLTNTPSISATNLDVSLSPLFKSIDL